jgi:hypothetical protein
LNKPKTSLLNLLQRTHNPKVAGSNPAPYRTKARDGGVFSRRARGTAPNYMIEVDGGPCRGATGQAALATMTAFMTVPIFLIVTALTSSPCSAPA